MQITIGSLALLSACTRQPRTDEELISKAQQAVDQKLDAQAQFSMMEAAVAQRIACGHSTVNGTGQDFVYRDGKVILDTEIDFDHAAIQCDEAVGGGNIQSDDGNT